MDDFMCGIVGQASISAIVNRTWLDLGRDAMQHRGPDDKGSWWSDDGRVALAQRRLSIIDLTEGGHQPMHTTDGQLTIVFNGEIYNFGDLRDELAVLGHAFRSRSDTEVILAAYRQWGTDCLNRLVGMFSIAIYDSKENRLFLARDRAGEKPLFYTIANGTISFASELKALFADPDFGRVIEPSALDSYLAYGYIAGSNCIIKGAKKLPPGHALIFNIADGTNRVWQYWNLPESRPSSDIGESELVDQLEALLEQSVQRQMVADVPVGVLLSGGVDSSLVTAFAVRRSSKVRTFTVTFEGDAIYDESKYARQIADHFGTTHTELSATSEGPELLDILARQFDEPMIDSSMIPTYLVSRLVREHCTVALGGDGGDELFGGYEHHRRLLWMQQRARKIPAPIRYMISAAATRILPTGFKGRNWLQALGVSLDDDLPAVAAQWGADERRTLLGKDWQTTAERERAARVPKAASLIERATRMDFHNYMAEDILVKVDRASMLASLEMRAPFLDHRLIEFAFGKVPGHLKATPNEHKILLKRLCARVLPPSFNANRKQGFSIPLPRWLRSGRWNEMARATLESSTLFDRKATLALLDGHMAGRQNAERLFGLLLFEKWRREYGIQG
jgi:asparagine synthase (glutamine-hydrolysing)